MKIGFHPVMDNPIRMGYVAGWSTIEHLVERLGDLEHAVGEGRVVPARWEPFYQECPSCRFAGGYEWARKQLQNPLDFPIALALFPGEEKQLTTSMGRANWMILCTKSEPSRITRQLMLAEALGLWESQSTEWLEQITETCAGLGVETASVLLRQQVLRALQPLIKDRSEDEPAASANLLAGSSTSHAFDKELLQMDGWTPDPGPTILPVDGVVHAFAREILLLDLRNVVLLRARKSVRTVPWEKVTLIHLSEGAVTFELSDGPALVVAGYRHPEIILRTAHKSYKAATERLLQSVATKVIRPTP